MKQLDFDAAEGRIRAIRECALVKNGGLSLQIHSTDMRTGHRDKSELERVKKALGASSARIAPVTAAVCERAMRLIDQYALSGGLQLGDALIAATALEHGLPLLTANIKHFGAIESLIVERFDPTQNAL